MFWAIFGLTMLGVILWGPIVSNVKQAKYKLIQSDRNIEIRDYETMIVAEAEVLGERKKAISEGFRIIADYIFGNNSDTKKVAMTAPVIQQSDGDNKTWKVRFVMPSDYTMETLPKPNNKAITLKEVIGSRFVVINFSGMANEDDLKQKEKELKSVINLKKLVGISAPIYAFYNPPWTLPFLRHNEIMIEIIK